MTTTVVNNSLFRSLFEKQKLTGNNFLEWYRNLQIVLSTKDKLPFLEQPISTLPVQKEITKLMLMTMNPEIQKTLEPLGAYDMLKELKTLYVQQAYQELLQIVQEFQAYKQEEGYMGKTVNELHAMLKLHEQTLPLEEVAPALHVIRAGRIQKNQKKKSHKAAKGNQGKGKGLRGSRKLKPGALCLYVGDGHRAAIEAIGHFYLCLPSGLVLILHNCHFAPSITRVIISDSHLYKDGFVNRFENDKSKIFVFKNNMIYFNAILRDDIYEIVMSSSNTNESSMYAVTNKRAKLNLDSALLWHCRLGHINKKRIKKLQHDGLVDSTDIKSFEKCVACMFGKMARKPYSHQVKRAKDLLGLIHTNCFKKEVENQLGKTIKSLRSDRGGEYMSQEFLDHLNDHGIIARRTPPYTP
ncbi:zinc finger, CCHC-type containing protein [Tanacetum coccineum]